MSELEKLRFQLDAWSSGGSEPDEGRLDVLEAPLQVIQILGVCSRWKLIEILLLSVADHFTGPGRRELRHKICASRKFSGMTAKHLQIFPCERVLLAGAFRCFGAASRTGTVRMCPATWLSTSWICFHHVQLAFRSKPCLSSKVPRYCKLLGFSPGRRWPFQMNMQTLKA